MASGDLLGVWFAPDFRLPATLYATLGTITGASTPNEAWPTLDFDDTTVEYADVDGYMPAWYAGGGVTLTYIWGAAAATNNGAWASAFRAVGDDTEDLDTTDGAYDYNQTADLTPPSAVGEVAYDTLTFTDGADMDSVAAGQMFRLRTKRPAPSGTKITGDQRLVAIVMKET